MTSEESLETPLVTAEASGDDDPGVDSTEEPRPHSGNNASENSLTGLLVMVLSTGCFSFMTLMVKVGTKMGLGVLQLVFARSLFQLVAGVITCSLVGVHPLGPKARMPWMAARGACGAFGLAAFFFSISVMDLGDATTLFFTGPIFTAALGHIFLGERITPVVSIASIISFSGVVLMSRPAFVFKGAQPLTALEITGAASALAGAMLAATAYVIVRKLGTSVHFLVSVVWFGLVSTAVSGTLLQFHLPGFPNQAAALTGQEWAVVFGAGASAFLGQCLLNAGLQLAPVGPGTLMRNLDVVFAYTYQVFLLHNPAQLSSIAGASAITLSALIIGLHKWYLRVLTSRRE